MSDQNQQYTIGEHPDMDAPVSSIGFVGWMRENLFSSPLNTILTLIALYIIYITVPPVIDWAFISADWSGDNKDVCSREGACWPFISTWFKFLMYGRYPVEELWRINTMYVIGGVTLAGLIMPGTPYKKWLGLFLLVIYPIIAFIMFVGGAFGLELVETPLWGGLFLTLVIGITGIVVSLPIGIVLALGRRSHMPVIRSVCVAFIEFWRGVPLITVLFMSSVMFPLFLPEGMNFDKLIRALAGVALFSSAYMAEVVRGGLQAIPKGQYEAAGSLGLPYWKTMNLVVLPQALKLVIPGIVNTFIGLFKDTTLVLIIGLFDLLGSAQAALTNPKWPGFSTEAYVFTAFTFWVFCFSMSRYSQSLEKKLHTGH
ncbi:MAG: amino acid ABC transporter permease [Rhodospirillales bacterium]|nr:amino acid ABC transporter permease [Rhodospirillales bacterium]